ncbi:MAG: hypothetical protein AAFQ02_09310, partial [Bacteroidota bacterium]
MQSLTSGEYFGNVSIKNHPFTASLTIDEEYTITLSIGKRQTSDDSFDILIGHFPKLGNIVLVQCTPIKDVFSSFPTTTFLVRYLIQRGAISPHDILHFNWFKINLSPLFDWFQFNPFEYYKNPEYYTTLNIRHPKDLRFDCSPYFTATHSFNIIQNWSKQERYSFSSHQSISLIIQSPFAISIRCTSYVNCVMHR